MKRNDLRAAYLVLTTKCRGGCRHCPHEFASSGEDMTLEMARRVLDSVTFCVIGGGEPTEHPELFSVVEYALERGVATRVTTAGYNVSSVQRLLDMAAAHDGLSVSVSEDEFHPALDTLLHARVSAHASAFLERPLALVLSDRNRQTLTPADLERYKTTPACSCPVVICWPDGPIRQCYCPGAPVVGRITEDTAADLFALSHCYREDTP